MPRELPRFAVVVALLVGVAETVVRFDELQWATGVEASAELKALAAKVSQKRGFLILTETSLGYIPSTVNWVSALLNSAWSPCTC